MPLWEILVPRVTNGGEEIPLSHHTCWDDKVREIANGLTILKSAKGIWKSPTGEVFSEGMIPVRISCSEEHINTIIDFTILHYDQEAVMAYCVSTQVIIRHRE